MRWLSRSNLHIAYFLIHDKNSPKNTYLRGLCPENVYIPNPGVLTCCTGWRNCSSTTAPCGALQDPACAWIPPWTPCSSPRHRPAKTSPGWQSPHLSHALGLLRVEPVDLPPRTVGYILEYHTHTNIYICMCIWISFVWYIPCSWYIVMFQLYSYRNTYYKKERYNQPGKLHPFIFYPPCRKFYYLSHFVLRLLK